MKKFLLTSLLIPFTFVSPSHAQQVNVYNESYCYSNMEQYVPGYYTSNGNYVSGYVNKVRNRVPCNGNVVSQQQPPQQYYYQRRRVCNPTAGALLGAGIAEAVSGGRGWQTSSSWSRNYTRNSSSGSYNSSNRNYGSNGWTLFGAGLGSLMFSC
jgi:hypothetical protein